MTNKWNNDLIVNTLTPVFVWKTETGNYYFAIGIGKICCNSL